TLRRQRVVADPVDLQVGRARIGEAVRDVTVGVDLPVRTGFGQLLAECHDLLRRNHRVVPAVEGDDFRLDLIRGQARRIEQAMKADGGNDIGTAPREVACAHSAKAIARHDDLALSDLIKSAGKLEHMLQPPKECGPIALQAVHLAEHRIARGATELLAEQVGNERIVAELDELAAETDLKVGHAHYRRDHDHRRPRLSVPAPDEYAFELLALEIVGDGPVLTHWSSLASSASLATVFMLRAV